MREEKQAEATPEWPFEAAPNWLGLFTRQVATGDPIRGTTTALT